MGKKDVVLGKERLSPVSICSTESPLTSSLYAKCLPSGEREICSRTGLSGELEVSCRTTSFFVSGRGHPKRRTKNPATQRTQRMKAGGTTINRQDRDRAGL